MKFFRILNCFFVIAIFSAGARALAQENQPDMETKRIGLAIHGGAGTIERSKMTPEKEREYRAGLERALTAGCEILKRGGSSLDATEAAVRVLETIHILMPAKAPCSRATARTRWTLPSWTGKH